MRRYLLLAFSTLLFMTGQACVTSSQTRMGSGKPLIVRRVERLERWSVELAGNRVGILSKLRVADATAPVDYYEVCRPDGQVVGRIDEHGRASRLEPFQEKAVYIKMDSMKRQLQFLLALDAEPAIRDWKLAEASATPKK